ncbi:DUF7696 family protein [Ralstonia pseudosolanacearum]|uniref:DUF7696 family protein n=1 Tax=Ralstonia pseudosolanacearum TaxID=1310165 RepID=UPI002B28BB2A|nr:hypothetical protein MAFF211520_18770 [Ralstonia pseudosolanacearum]BEU56826.1 hypothetical protein MAFF211521_18790 [Ralstonia pseudosolanacearum]BEU62485.1 hypothetical protein MAFF301524_22850 [Ralstonia pseudosolanacearum]
MRCRCPSCSASPAPSYTETYRLECEARYVCSLPDKPTRHGYLDIVERRRGLAAREALAREVIRQWQRIPT